jgi:hypothetical protein
LDDGCQFLVDLENLPAEFSDVLRLKLPNSAVQVNLFSSRRSYERYVAKRFPEGAGRRALYIKGPDMGQVYVYRHADCDTDLRHEATHALLHSALPYLPLWLDEGLAEYFEVPAGQRVAANPHAARLRWSLRFGWQPHLARLEQLRQLDEMRNEDYREAWAWVHFMLHGPDAARPVLIKYLNDIQTSDPPGPLSTRLFEALPDAGQRLAEHVRSH